MSVDQLDAFGQYSVCILSCETAVWVGVIVGDWLVHGNTVFHERTRTSDPIWRRRNGRMGVANMVARCITGP